MKQDSTFIIWYFYLFFYNGLHKNEQKHLFYYYTMLGIRVNTYSL